MQKETNMVVASWMTCKIGLIWHHMKTLYSHCIIWQSYDNFPVHSNKLHFFYYFLFTYLFIYLFIFWLTLSSYTSVHCDINHWMHASLYAHQTWCRSEKKKEEEEKKKDDKDVKKALQRHQHIMQKVIGSISMPAHFLFVYFCQGIWCTESILIV